MAEVTEKKEKKDKSKVHKLSLKGSSKLVAEFFNYSINTILFQRGVYPAEDFTAYALPYTSPLPFQLSPGTQSRRLTFIVGSRSMDLICWSAATTK